MSQRVIKLAHERTRVKTQSDPDRKSRVVQSEKNNSDINTIVAKAHVTKQLPVLMGRQHIENLPDSLTYQDALNKVVYAQQAFARLPSSVRNEFGNDPVQLLNALQDPKTNMEKLLKAKVLEPVSEVIDPIVAELRKLNSASEKPPSAPTTQAQEALTSAPPDTKSKK